MWKSQAENLTLTTEYHVLLPGRGYFHSPKGQQSHTSMYLILAHGSEVARDFYIVPMAGDG